MGRLGAELETFELRTLVGILLSCLEVADKCRNTAFSQRLVEVIMARLQAANETGALVESQRAARRAAELDAAMRDEAYLVQLLAAFSRLKLQGKLAEHFDLLNAALNRAVGNYSAERLVELCVALGDLYLASRHDGLRMLLQRAVSTLVDRVGRYGAEVPLYSWIQVIRAISKCNETHLLRRVAPCLLQALQASPLAAAVHGGAADAAPTDDRRLYAFVKLSVNLLNTLLLVGMVDNVHLIEHVLRLVSSYLTGFVGRSARTVPRFTPSDQYATSPLVDQLLYPRCGTKLFRAPPQAGAQADQAPSAGPAGVEENLVHAGLLRLLHSGKTMFVRGVKMAEMQLRCAYPAVYAQLAQHAVLRAARSLRFHSDRDYEQAAGLLRDNMDRIVAQLRLRELTDSPSLLVAPVDTFYLISLAGPAKLYLHLAARPGAKIPRGLEFKFRYLASLGWERIDVPANLVN